MSRFFEELTSLPSGWVLLFQNSAVIHKVAKCVIPMQIRYILIHFIHHIRTGPLHKFMLVLIFVCHVNCTRSPQDKSQSVSLHQFETQGTKIQAKSWFTILHRTQSTANIPAKTVNNEHISLSATAKDTSRQIPCIAFSTKLKTN